MLTTFCYALGGCATEPLPSRPTVVETDGSSKGMVAATDRPMTALPSATAFPELEATVRRQGFALMRTLGYDDYEVSAVLPQSADWRYVRDPRLRVVVRRETPIGFAVRGREQPNQCFYLEPTVVQDRVGALDWGPLRLAASSYRARRLDCGLLSSSLASR